MANRRVKVAVGVAAVGVSLGAVALGSAASANDDRDRRSNSVSERLSGFEEDPLVISTDGTGRFTARISERAGEINWELRYSGLEGTVTQAHIHLGGEAQSGGIAVWLCNNTNPAAPAGTQACPAAPATVTGTSRAADVVAIANQSLEAGNFAAFLTALQAEKTYVNVHSSLFPGGEIRGQIDHDH